METHIEFTHQTIVEPAQGNDLRATGAEVEFRGIVRESEDGRTIEGLQYEAHEEMARRQLQRIMDEAGKEWPCQEVRFIHRLGWVPVGEASLYVRVRASHRGEAFRFCMALIDRMKADAPIWKLNT
jgi:molybdopterin synthase catalytic subunit